MKTKIRTYPAMMKRMVVPAILAAAVTSALAQISASDPTLRLWLKADTLTGPTVPVWTDSSSHGVILAVPQPLPPMDLESAWSQANGDDTETRHTPLLSEIDNNGITFKAVTFRQGFDPVTPDPNQGHFADRLWQTNMLDETDPTLIDASEDLTLILVYRNLHVGQALGSHQAILAKRGPGSCPLWLGLDGAAPSHEIIAYASPLFYPSSFHPPTALEWSIVILNLTADGTATWREYYASRGGWNSNTQTGVARNGKEVGVPFTIASHAQRAGASDGNPYGNGLYERFTGDIAEVALYNRSLSDEEMAAIQQSLLVKYFLKAGPPTITTQPQALEVNEFEPVTLSVAVDGTPPFTYQWFKGGQPIAGATGASYSLLSARPDDAGFYTVAITNSIGYATSEAAYLTVVPDTVAPAVVSALLNYVDNTQVQVTFTELVDPASATNKENYSINNSVTVDDVVAIPQTSDAVYSNHVFAVMLTTTPITEQSRLTVNGVQDRAGKLATDSQADILVPGTPGTPPEANRLLWLAADSGVLADAIGVYEWVDQAGAANIHSAVPTSFGNPLLGVAAFPNGLHPVVTFDGGTVMALQNQPDFNIQTLSVYVVGAVDTSKPSRNWAGNWEGWTIGTSDGNPSAIKWVTHTTAGDFSLETPAGTLVNMAPNYIVGTFAFPGDKTLSLNGRLMATQSGTAEIVYTTARGLALGALFDDTTTQPLVGNIAEILVYSAVSPAQDAAVQAYIGAKYFSPAAVPPKPVSATNSAPNTVVVSFSENLDAATATAAGSYTIDHGVTVDSAVLVNPTTVELTTSALAAGTAYTLTVNGVKNWAGATVAPNSQVPIAMEAVAAVTLTIVKEANGSITLSWPGDGWQLESVDALGGTWSAVTGATSPHTVTPGSENKFYRLSR